MLPLHWKPQTLSTSDLNADSSTPTNFTIFAFRKQEPNTDNRQEDYFVCHLIWEEEQKSQ